MKEKLKKLQAKSENYTIPELELTLPIQGLSFSELVELVEFGEKKDVKGSANYMLYVTLRKALPKVGEEAVSDEEVREIVGTLDGSHGAELLRRVQKLSGLEVKEADEKKSA